MRIGAVVRSYGLTDYLPAVLRSYAWVEKVVVMNYRFKNVRVREDKTEEIASRFKNTVLFKGDNLDQHETLNAGVEKFAGFDSVFIADADELISRVDQYKLVAELGGYEAGACKIVDYVDTFTRKLPERTHKAIVIVKPTVRFYEVRCFAGKIKNFDVSMHHFGYVYQPEAIAWKLDWERHWEQGSTKHLLGQVQQDCEVPAEIQEWLKE